MRARRADLELEGELQDVLLVGERDVEDVLLLRLDGSPSLALHGVGELVAAQAVVAPQRQHRSSRGQCLDDHRAIAFYANRDGSRHAVSVSATTGCR